VSEFSEDISSPAFGRFSCADFVSLLLFQLLDFIVDMIFTAGRRYA
jgi:hypothetical protein